ncbi:MAG: DUF58 domain-containing protein [Leadbetterella sp.]
MKRFFKQIYFTKWLFITLLFLVGLFMVSILHEPLFLLSKILLVVVVFYLFAEVLMLFMSNGNIGFVRRLPFRLSNGDVQSVNCKITSSFSIRLHTEIYEDLPYQFQSHFWKANCELAPRGSTVYTYQVRATVRGQYVWGNTTLLIKLFPWSFVSKRITFEARNEVACYPSFEQFSKLPIQAIVSNYIDNSSYHQVRRIGQSLEFEQIKNYSSGDDYRHINWKASAKRGDLMVNQYMQERSQEVYAVLDLGRTMHMPFDKMTLLDYSINGALALTKVATQMDDKAGVITFKAKECTHLPAKKDLKQFSKINDYLYGLNTQFLESDFEVLYKYVRINIKTRSLFVIFTHFDSVEAMYRQLPYLRALSKHQLLLVVFFENTENKKLADSLATDLEKIYTVTIAQNFVNQYRLIAKELMKNGILALSVEPSQLSLEVINSFVDIKRKQLL